MARRLVNMFPGRREAIVNSIHHQAVKTLGRDLNIEAVSASDGIIEAVRYRRAPFVMGVQWHPEFHRAGGRSCSIARRCSIPSCGLRAKRGFNPAPLGRAFGSGRSGSNSCGALPPCSAARLARLLSHSGFSFVFASL
jgi:Predicted glutamine amidotransferases